MRPGCDIVYTTARMKKSKKTPSTYGAERVFLPKRGISGASDRKCLKMSTHLIAINLLWPWSPYLIFSNIYKNRQKIQVMKRRIRNEYQHNMSRYFSIYFSFLRNFQESAIRQVSSEFGLKFQYSLLYDECQGPVRNLLCNINS